MKKLLVLFLIFILPISIYAELTVDGYSIKEYQLFGLEGLTSAPAVSSAAKALLYYNSIDDDLYLSKNGASYELILSETTGDAKYILKLGDTTGAMTSDLNLDDGTLVLSYDDNRVGIGTTSPSSKLDLTDGSLSLGDSDVAHGMTSAGFGWATNDYGYITPMSGTNGGLAVFAGSDADAGAFQLTGVMGTNDPTDTTPAVNFRVGKRDGGGTSWTTLGSSETAFKFVNYNQNIMTMLGSGNVGIGTASPDNLLHVHKATLASAPTDANSLIVAENSTYSFFQTIGATRGGLLFGDAAAAAAGAIIYDHQGVATDSMSFWTAATQRMTIDSSGNVGIGTTSPNSTLEISTGINATPGNNNGIYITSSGKTAQIFPRLAGRIAIAPDTSVTGSFVDMYTSSGNFIYEFQADSGDAIFRSYGQDFQIETDNGAYPIKFAINEVEKMRVHSDGNVGIGTTSPNAKLDIGSGNLELDDAYNLRWGTVSRAFIQGTSGGSGYLAIGTNGSGRVRIDSSGNVGIGTVSPYAGLEIQSGNVSFNHGDGNHPQLLVATDATSQTAGDGGQIDLGTYMDDVGRAYAFASIRGIAENSGTNNSGALILGTTASDSTITERMRIDSSGNVGIGTASPTAQLQVAINGTGNALKLGRSDSNGYLTYNMVSNYSNFNSYGDYNFAIQSNNYLTIKDSGNVGIGTASPEAQLEMVRELTGASEAAGFGLVLDYTSSGSDGVSTLRGIDVDLGVGYTGAADTYAAIFDNDVAGTGTNYGIRVSSDSSTAGNNIAGYFNATNAGAGNAYGLIVANGNVGIGTTSPDARLDVIGGNFLLFTNNDTDTTNKAGIFGTKHYDTDEEPVAGMFIESENGVNNIKIGGGSGAANAATSLSFWTQTNATTVQGSSRMVIASDGSFVFTPTDTTTTAVEFDLDTITTGTGISVSVDNIDPLGKAFDIDDNGTSLFSVLGTGRLTNIDGISSVTTQYGSSLLTYDYGDKTALHTGLTGSYDHTGGTYEKMFTKTAGDDFTQEDADNGNFIVMAGANISAAAEIVEYINATTVIVDGLGWIADIPSQSFNIFNPPAFVTGDGYNHKFNTKDSGEFEVYSYDYTESNMADFHLDSAGDNMRAMYVEAIGNGYNTVNAATFNYNTGNLQPGDSSGGILVTMDDTGATSADSTTRIAAYNAITTDSSNAEKRAVNIFPGFTQALVVQGASSEDPDYGYETTSGTSTDRVNSGGGGNDAFVNPAVDVQIFDSNSDDILIGSDATFEVIAVNLAVNASKSITPTFWYSKAGGNWTALTIDSDGTNGFTQSGQIILTAPGDWTKDDEDIDGNAITDAYYIAITRTEASTIPTKPTEDYFKIYADRATGMNITGGGFIQPRVAADADAPNNSIYYSTDQSKLVYKDSGGTVNDLY